MFEYRFKNGKRVEFHSNKELTDYLLRNFKLVDIIEMLESAKHRYSSGIWNFMKYNYYKIASKKAIKKFRINLERMCKDERK